MVITAILLVSGVLGADEPTPEARALAYLVREVPAWSPANKCYSCHNNGDAARALFLAKRLGYAVPEKALADTLRWLEQPERWDHNGGEEYSDKKVARIQFASALVEALDAGLVKDRRPLRRAAEMVVEFQRADGSWPVDAAAPLGTPATLGDALATWTTTRTLRQADPEYYRDAIRKAEGWLGKFPIKTVPEAAAVLLWLGSRQDPAAEARRKEAVALLGRAQSRDGGWGPYVTSPPEAFDTAIALLGLAHVPDAQGMVGRGRRFLIEMQNPDGSWPETTRPSGTGSYAQRLSTTGWATLALLRTR